MDWICIGNRYRRHIYDRFVQSSATVTQLIHTHTIGKHNCAHVLTLLSLRLSFSHVFDPRIAFILLLLLYSDIIMYCVITCVGAVLMHADDGHAHAHGVNVCVCVLVWMWFNILINLISPAMRAMEGNGSTTTTSTASRKTRRSEWGNTTYMGCDVRPTLSASSMRNAPGPTIEHKEKEQEGTGKRRITMIFFF